MVSIIDTVTSIFASVVVFSILGFKVRTRIANMNVSQENMLLDAPETKLHSNTKAQDRPLCMNVAFVPET